MIEKWANRLGMEMHPRPIDLQTWADVRDDLEKATVADLGSYMVTIGEHPHLGAVVAVQAEEGVMLLTELIYQSEIDRRLAEPEQEEAVRAVVFAATSRKRHSASH